MSLPGSNENLQGLVDSFVEAYEKGIKREIDESARAFPDDGLAWLVQQLFVANEQQRDNALVLISVIITTDPPKQLPKISKAVLEYCQTFCEDEEATIHISDSQLQALVNQMVHKDNIQVASHASDALVCCCRKLPLADKLVPVLLERAQMSRSDSTLTVRYATILIEIMAIDAMNRDAVLSHKVDRVLFLPLLTNATDPLTQMSVLEVLSQNISSLASWLLQDNILDALLGMAGGSEADAESDPLLGGIALRILAQLSQEPTDKLLRGFYMALRNYPSNGEVDRLEIVDAIRSFASSSPEALETVLKDDTVRERWLSLNVVQPKLKSAILQSVAMAVEALGSAAMALFLAVGQTNHGVETTVLLLNLAKSPVVETRLAVYLFLSAVARAIPTGAQVLLTYPDFFPFLMNREGEAVKEAKEAQFGLVKAVYESQAKGLLADDVVKSLEKFISEGPFHVKTIPWEMAAE